MATEATLCLIIRDGQVLLLLKSKGRFGGGKWNGLGGKLLPGESPLECVRREVGEESGLEIEDPRLRGKLRFQFGDDWSKDWVVHVFSAREFTGELRSSDEGSLRWFAAEDIPYSQMWEDDRHWLPLLLGGASFSGSFRFDLGGTRLLSFDLASEPGEPL
ncbi:MAG: 8-oxo-dGTP diphosphatase [Conexivisphaerales archaeon]|jgi:8-oxo-dGTP diphosphatase